MAHAKTEVKSYKLLKSGIKVGSTLEDLYLFSTEDGEILGYVSGVADKMVLNSGFYGEISYWDLGTIYTRERYPDLFVDDRTIHSVALISEESSRLNDDMVRRIYG